MKKLLSLLLILMLLIPTALADEVIPANAKHERPEIEGVGEDGFLTGEGAEYVLADAEEGLWMYVSETLRIEIDRYTASNRKLIWYTAHIRQKEGDGMHTFLADPAHPFGLSKLVEEIARQYQLVFAINGDFFEDRYREGEKIGCVIKNSVVINRYAQELDNLPTLDVLALFEDGTMKCFKARSNSADKYLAMGVRDTICFGPILVSGGSINMKQLEDYGRSREPRTALGMVENGHYVAIVCEGRSEESDGLRLSELAPLMLAEGCVEALNLDGGQTSVLSFMGEKLNATGTFHNSSRPRRVTDIVGIGVSNLVSAE